MITRNNTPHGCRDCGEVDSGYTVKHGKKLCLECGGTVLYLQEAFDYIIQLKRELEDRDNSES